MHASYAAMEIKPVRTTTAPVPVRKIDQSKSQRDGQQRKQEKQDSHESTESPESTIDTYA
jgi:hypothetical protein